MLNNENTLIIIKILRINKLYDNHLSYGNKMIHILFITFIYH